MKALLVHMIIRVIFLFDPLWRLLRAEILQKILVPLGATEFQEKMLLRFPDLYYKFILGQKNSWPGSYLARIFRQFSAAPLNAIQKCFKKSCLNIWVELLGVFKASGENYRILGKIFSPEFEPEKNSKISILPKDSESA